MRFLGFDHVTISIPRGEEAAARGFYGGVLGLREIPRPDDGMIRPGMWFELGAQQLHIGVEDEFRGARLAHPALLVDDLAACRAAVTAAKIDTVDGPPVPGYVRFFSADPFGNRLEFMQRL